ncbi:MAG: hypothetical protein MUE99_05695, partial [Chitinophagaceae bacterium]|nr:hypothetical protein [Chitinophagaceae bacterium]
MRYNLLFIICIFLHLMPSAQQPTRQQMEQKQKEAIEQLKKMGISIDPNKPMSKEEAEKFKRDLQKQAGAQSNKIKETAGIQTAPKYSYKNIDISKAVTSKTVVAIAERFFKRSYATLNAIDKSTFDNDYQKAQKDSFSLKSVRRLADLGVEHVAFGCNHFMAALYITSAIKANPTDTAAINNFGGYLRLIDSVKTSLPVLQYAYTLDSTSPVIATQFAATLFELGDDKKSEKILIQTLRQNPDHWGAHEGLCLIYFTRGEIDKAMEEVFRSARAGGGGTSAALFGSIKAQQQMNVAQKGVSSKSSNTSNNLRDICKPAVYDVKDFDSRVHYPKFPVVQKPEDWTSGGGYAQAVKVYDAFHKNLKQFIERRKAVAMEPQPVKPGAFVRSYTSERLMIYGIIDIFKTESKKNDEAYKTAIDKILNGMDETVTAYTDIAERAQKVMTSCMEKCGETNPTCQMKCLQQYCMLTCPAAELCNNNLSMLFNQYTRAFNDYRKKQEELLDDFYAFSQPWVDKIESGYWSRQIEFDRKAFALGVVADGYINYALPFVAPVEGCPDCSIIYMVFEDKPSPTSTEDPDSKPCNPSAKIGISLVICEVELDCESIEFGCTAGVSVSLKRNFVKKNTTVFLGVGVEGKSELFKAGGKMGGTLTFDDKNNVVDFGYKSEVGFETKVGGKTGLGGTMESSYSFQKG